MTAEPPERVLHVLNGASGGAAATTIGLIEGLTARGIESSAVCHDAGSSDDRDRLSQVVSGRVQFTHLWWWNRRTRARWQTRPALDVRESIRTGRGARSGRAVEQFARDQRADLIHTNTILTPEGAIAARAIGLPHVWHLREMVGRGHPFRFWFEPRFFSRRVGPNCDVLVANSDAALSLVARWLPDGKAAVVANGLDLTPFLDIGVRSETPLVVGMVANLTSRWKRHDLFIEAAARVKTDVPLHFVLVGTDPALDGGTDPYAEGLHQRVDELGLSTRFTFAGHQPDPVETMKGIDILLHPCGDESFGRIAVEAMAAGRPVVGVAAGGIGEVVEQEVTGLLVPPGDVDGLARAVEALAADPDRRQAMGAAGRRRAVDTYGIDAMVDGMVDVYRRAIEMHRGR